MPVGACGILVGVVAVRTIATLVVAIAVDTLSGHTTDFHSRTIVEIETSSDSARWLAVGFWETWFGAIHGPFTSPCVGVDQSGGDGGRDPFDNNQIEIRYTTVETRKHAW